jgi:hypothetical protein
LPPGVQGSSPPKGARSNALSWLASCGILPQPTGHDCINFPALPRE